MGYNRSGKIRKDREKRRKKLEKRLIARMEAEISGTPIIKKPAAAPVVTVKAVPVKKAETPAAEKQVPAKKAPPAKDKPNPGTKA